MDRTQSDIAIIGAGMAGLTCALALGEQGFAVRVFDKGRGPGGRMAARRAEIAGEKVSFDHGAQYFAAKSSEFTAQIAAWADAGVVAPWPVAGEDAWVGVPGMNGPLRHMSQQAEVSWGARIERLEREGEGWVLFADGGTHRADIVLVAVPAEQAAGLLAEVAPELAAIPATIQSEPCWALMAAFEEQLPITGDCLNDEGGAIGWAARNSAKPSRTGQETWVIHGSAEWSRANLEQSLEEATSKLLAAFFSQTQLPFTQPLHAAAHRWRYAFPQVQSALPAHWDPKRGIGLAGDYLVAPRVEGAWLSGKALAAMIAQGK
ncbi:MAG: NAD(P)-binding protein [Altererythrobacter sp.]|nr:NAD(P)-binding protein [Altererythrobacter sp.]